MSNPNVDFGRHSEDYAEHRPGMPDSFYARLEGLVALAGASVLDLGTGPGHTALALAERGASVTGIDISTAQIESARRAAAQRHLEGRATFLVRPAERSGLPEASFDLVIATQCWGWFDHDAALREMALVLRAGGLLVVAHYCYLPGRSAVAQRTEELVLRHNPGWTMAGSIGVYPQHVDGLQEQGMQLVEQFCYDHRQPFTHAGWRGRMRTCNGVGSGTLSDAQVAAFDKELGALLAGEFPVEPLMIEHRVWAVITRKGTGQGAGQHP